MSEFKFMKTELEDAYLIQPFYSEDLRGSFQKTFENITFSDIGLDFNVSEIFHSKSKKGVLRGLHFQKHKSQAKIVNVIAGEIFDVIVDIREGSSTYLQWQGFELSEKNRNVLYVPKGFAHGFLTLSETALVSYICEGDYIKEYDTGVRWDDEKIGIDWKLEDIGGKENLIISDRDNSFSTL